MTLDELHGALALATKPRPSDWGALLQKEHVRLLEPLRAFLSELQLAGAARARTDWSVPTPHMPTLGGSLDALQLAIAKRARDILGDAGVSALRRLLADPQPDFLAVMGRRDNENAHSDLLRWLLDQRCAPTVAPAALRRMADFLDGDRWQSLFAQASQTDSIAVRREFAIDAPTGDASDRLDILISGPGFLVVIENKVGSDEGEDQTHRYWRWISSKTGLRDRAALFLTPHGVTPGCPSFRPISYLQLLCCLLEASSQGSLTVDEQYVLAGYVKTIARSILRAELHGL